MSTCGAAGLTSGSEEAELILARAVILNPTVSLDAGLPRKPLPRNRTRCVQGLDRPPHRRTARRRSDIRAWLVVLLDGEARTRPRSHTTVRVHFGILPPFIEDWAATRGRPWEITSGNADAVLEVPRSGSGSATRHDTA